ncbi:MAG: ParB/RepB/Spo0J family partition protein [Kiritimatiellae bacterium]|nr:ParB/RepB/Spo0J family partition protein [Kiritimatiellia bacterium]
MSAKKTSKKTAASKKPQPKAKPAAPRPGIRPPVPASSARPQRSHLGRGIGALLSSAETDVAIERPRPDAVAAPVAPVSASVLPPSPKPLVSAPKAPVSAAPAVPANARFVIEVPIAEISRSPWQPRTVFDEEKLNELAESIKTQGVMSPLLCRKLANGRYELINGERRLRASSLAGLAKVPVLLVDTADRNAAEMAIIENIQREDLNVIEEAEGYRTLADRFSLTQQEISERVGKPRPTIANALRLLDLPDEVKQLVGSNLLSTGHAKVLLGLSDTTEQTILGRKCVTEALTVRALERLIAKRKEEKTPSLRPVSKPDLPDNYVRDLSDRLHQRLHTAVRIQPGVTHPNGKHTKGILEIDFYDNDDLDRILNVLGVSPNAD